MIKDLQEKAKWFIRNDKILRISEGMFQVDDKIVTIKTKKGREVMSCSCENYSTFVTSGQICSHQIAVLIFDTHYKLFEKIKNLKEQYLKWKEHKFEIKAQFVIDDFEKLEKFI
jgi:hypothetical protein